jgi:hypothetical protein
MKVVYRKSDFEQKSVQRFMSVDPLTKSYPWYTPYQFAGNKPIRFVDLDGLEEGDKMLEVPTLAEMFVSTTRSIGDGLYNTAITINDQFRSEETQVNRIRTLLITKYGQSYNDVFAISNQALLEKFEVKFTFFNNENEGYYLDSKDGFWKEGLEGFSNAINIASAFGLKGNGLILGKIPSKNLQAVSKVVDDALDASKNLLKPESKYLGTGKHGIGWKEGPALAKQGTPQGQWGSTKDLDFAAKKASTLEPGKGDYFELPSGHTSVVHLPNGETVSATHIWVRNNGTGTFHGYPTIK